MSDPKLIVDHIEELAAIFNGDVVPQLAGSYTPDSVLAFDPFAGSGTFDEAGTYWPLGELNNE